MSAMTPLMPPHPVQHKASPWNTPRVLRLARLVIVVLTALLAFVVYIGVTAHRAAITTVGVDTAPSIIAAQSMKAEMAGMDADLANELLSIPGGGGGSLNNYDAARGRAAEKLLEASENITNGEGELGPIRTLHNGQAVYEDLAQRARDRHDALATDADSTPTPVLDAYHEAETMTDRSLLPAADDVDAVNLKALDGAYKTREGESAVSTAVVIFCGLLLLASLVGAQVFLSRRMRRTLNPALAVAAFLVLWVTFYAVDAMSSSQRHLRVAREDAFASVHLLLRARAAAFEADSMESRWLLEQTASGDSKRAAQAQAAFGARSREVVTLPPGSSVQEVLAEAAKGTHPDDFTGYLADELRNVTFPGERDAAAKTLVAWQQYLRVDAKIREERRSDDKTKQADALSLATGARKDGADAAFDRFDAALQETLAINQKVFEDSVTSGMGMLNGIETKALIVAGLVVVLVFLGLMPRIREYA